MRRTKLNLQTLYLIIGIFGFNLPFASVALADTTKTKTSTTTNATTSTAADTTTSTPADTTTTANATNTTTSATDDNTALSDTTDITANKSGDPLEKFNRAATGLNDEMDAYLLQPVARGYNKVLPSPVRTGIGNFYGNIDEIPTVANDFLQGNCYQGYSDAWRFLINSTIGIGGFIDVASHMGLQPHFTDLGLTFAKWGWRESYYLTIPFFGPSTIRDGSAKILNYYAFTIYPWIEPMGVRAGMQIFNYVVIRADALAYQQLIEQAAFDRYIFQKTAYLQNRHRQIEETIHGVDWQYDSKVFVEQKHPALISLYHYQPVYAVTTMYHHPLHEDKQTHPQKTVKHS